MGGYRGIDVVANLLDPKSIRCITDTSKLDDVRDIGANAIERKGRNLLRCKTSSSSLIIIAKRENEMVGAASVAYSSIGE